MADKQSENTSERLQSMAIFAGLAIDYAKALQGLHPTKRDIAKMQDYLLRSTEHLQSIEVE